jgi:hypothetical protein
MNELENATPCNSIQSGLHRDSSEASNSDDKVSLTVEVCQASTSGANPAVIASKVSQYLSNRSFIYHDETISIQPEEDPYLASHVDSIRVCDTETDRQAPVGTHLLFWQVDCY